MSNRFTQISINMVRIIFPINIFLCLTSNCLNLIVLTRPSLFKYASTHYFLALSINSLFAAILQMTIDLLASGYQIILTSYSDVSCKSLQYLRESGTIITSYFIVLALIDRYFASSSNINLRNRTTIKMARRMIALMIVFFALLFTGTPILNNVNRDDGLGCAIRPTNVYGRVYPFIQTSTNVVLAPCLMIIFGILTIFNAKQVHIHPVGNIQNRRTDLQLTLMLLLQVFTHILLNLPISIIYMMSIFLPVLSMTIEFKFIFLAVRVAQRVSYSTPFFLYIMVGRIFRQELLLSIKKAFGRRAANRVQPLVAIGTGGTGITSKMSAWRSK